MPLQTQNELCVIQYNSNTTKILQPNFYMIEYFVLIDALLIEMTAGSCDSKLRPPEGGRLQEVRLFKIYRAFNCWVLKHCIMCCYITGNPGRRPLGHTRRHPNSPSRRRSSNGKDVLRRRHVGCLPGTSGSPVRRSQRLAGRRTPVGVGVSTDGLNWTLILIYA